MNWNARLTRMIPWLTLGLGLAATFGGWLLVSDLIEERERQRFKHEVEGLTEDILTHFETYNVIMRGAAGLFFASEFVGREEFRHYYNALDLPETYPGFLNLSYAEALSSREEVEAHAEWMRREGFPDFTIHPEVEGNEHAIVTLIEPFEGVNRNALGFDGASTESGRETMRRARDTGEVSLSGHTPLLRNTAGLNSSVIMIRPVYENGVDPGTVSGRRAALKGFVVGGIRLNELMMNLDSHHNFLINLAIYDGSDVTGTPLFEQVPQAEGGEGHELVRSIEFGGREWSLHFMEAPGFHQTAPNEPLIAAIAGLIFSLILFAITLVLARLERERRRGAEALLATEKKLRQAQKMEAIGQLTGGVAHDFNNLLQVILGNAELMLEQSKPGTPQHRLADLTQKAAERGAELTNRLLAFARRQALNPKPTDVNRLIAGMETLVHRALGEQVETRLIHDPTLMPAMVDPAQLESAVLNLCINARDAMPDGGTLTIETLNVTIGARDAARIGDIEAGDYVRITVRDTGSGMDKATMAQAFEPFFTTKEVGKGSGLGLSMVFGFAKQSNGHVKIESGIGQGTAVKLYLPASPDRLPGTAAPDERGNAEGGSETVLMVEDNALVRQNAETQLQTLGYDVIVAAGGQEALDILRSNRPCDLLFTDLVMPGGVDGHQLAVAARNLRPSLPVLFTTGYGGETISANRNSKSIRTLQKPYRRQDLADEIRDLLRHRPSNGERQRRV